MKYAMCNAVCCMCSGVIKPSVLRKIIEVKKLFNKCEDCSVNVQDEMFYDMIYILFSLAKKKTSKLIRDHRSWFLSLKRTLF